MSELDKFIAKNKHFPRGELTIYACQPKGMPAQSLPPITTFLSYSFQMSIIVPVSSFSFSFAYPTNPRSTNTGEPFAAVVKPGDIATFSIQSKIIFTGIIDTTDVFVDAQRGEVITINGRNILSQLEEHCAIDANNSPLYGQSMTLDSVLSKMIFDTRIQHYRKQPTNLSATGNLATSPGESKLDAILRHIESFNIIMWMDPNGTLVVGKPNASGSSPQVGNIICIKPLGGAPGYSNVLSIRAVDSSAIIPNRITVLWSTTVDAQHQLAKSQTWPNPAKGPNNLLKLGHIIPKIVVSSLPIGNSPQSFASLNQLISINGATQIQALAVREMMRGNFKELQVQAVAPGHVDENLNPYMIDSCYAVSFDSANIREQMYLYQVDYTMDESSGQRSALSFCKVGTIVGSIST